MIDEVTHLLLLQALPYVCLLIAMLFFIYAIIGMQVRQTCPCVPLAQTMTLTRPQCQPCVQRCARSVLRVEQRLWELQGPGDTAMACSVQLHSCFPTGTFGAVALGAQLGACHPFVPVLCCCQSVWVLPFGALP